MCNTLYLSQTELSTGFFIFSRNGISFLIVYDTVRRKYLHTCIIPSPYFLFYWKFSFFFFSAEISTTKIIIENICDFDIYLRNYLNTNKDIIIFDKIEFTSVWLKVKLYLRKQYKASGSCTTRSFVQTQ